MSSVDQWLNKTRRLTEDDKKLLADLKSRAMFSFYCQIGSSKGRGGTCMADFGALVAKHASRFGVEAKDLMQELLAEAAEKAHRGEWDV
jgi:hypothetical protein